MTGATAAPPSEMFSPWVNARVEFGERAFRADTAQTLMRMRLSLAKTVVLTEDVRFGRGEPMLNAFYHVVPAGSVLYVLGRQQSEKIVACTTTDTHVAANIFVREGRIESPTCLVDSEPDGRFDAVTWGAWSPRTHALRVQNVVEHDPPVAIDRPYELIDAPADFAESQFIEVQFSVFPERGVVEASVRGPDGAVLRRERLNLRRVRDVRTFAFFGCEIEIARVSEDEFSWRPLSTPHEGEPFRLTWRGD
ncbi:MAG: hypothetical protein ABL871_08705 [Terricaulis sp.]